VSAPLAARAIELLLYQVLTGAITRTIATEVTGQDLDLEQSYRFGFARLGPVLVVSILVGLATLLGLIVFIIPGIYIGVRLRSASRRWLWRTSGEPTPCAAPGIWSAATGGTRPLPCSSPP
jgi:ABC-type Fe3+ transport system permease subunit